MQRDVCGCVFTLAHSGEHPPCHGEGVTVGMVDVADVFFYASSPPNTDLQFKTS